MHYNYILIHSQVLVRFLITVC